MKAGTVVQSMLRIFQINLHLLQQALSLLYQIKETFISEECTRNNCTSNKSWIVSRAVPIPIKASPTVRGSCKTTDTRSTIAQTTKQLERKFLEIQVGSRIPLKWE